MTCPRCGAELVEHEPNIEWNRHWTCEECDLGFKLEAGVLVQGRDRPTQFRIVARGEVTTQ